MASYGSSPTEAVASFKKQLQARQGAAAIEAYGTKNPAILQALIRNEAFPPGDFQLGGVRLRASAGSDITFSASTGTVKFSAEGGGFAALGIYHSGSAAVAAMELDERLGFDLPTIQTEQPLFLVLQWGYDIAASGSGTVALGPVPVQFGAKGASHGKYAVIRRVPDNTPAITALESLLAAWTVPALVHSAADMEPGSWIITEVDGSIALNLAATYGYNFNWVREADFAGLQGTIGLKVQAGLSAALGFEASGAYLLALGRASTEQKVRLRLFRQRKNGFSFAFHAGATVEPSTGPFTKENFDQMVLAVLGLHHQQLIQDLQLVRDWAGGATPLSGIFKSVGRPYVQQLFRLLANSPAGQAYEAARAKVSAFLENWGNIDQRLTTEVWHLLGDYKDSLAEVQAITAKIASAQSAQDYLDLLNTYVPQPAFLVSPLGRWLETLAAGNLLSAVHNDAAFQDIKRVAGQVSPLLSDALDPGSVIRKLHDYLNQHIGLKQIQDVVDQASLNQLDDWVQAKIAAFLDQTVANLEVVKQVQQAIKLLFEKKDWFVNKAFAVLQQKYEADFAFTYQTTTTRDALLDVEFDFSKDNPSRQLTDAVRGRFDEILLKEVPGVVLHQGVLSHQIDRNTDVQLSLPYFTWKSNHLNSSLARIDASTGLVAGDEGLRVEIDLQSEDKVTKLVNSGGCVSHLALSSAIHAVSATGIHSFDESTLKFSYSFRKASRNLSRAEFQYQIGPQLELYLGKVFQGKRVADWTAELDDAVPYGKADHIGDVLFRLQLAYESRLLTGWLNAPDRDDDARYKRMSYAIQASLKRLIPQCYFASRSSFDNIFPAYVLAVYRSIPPATDANDVHWNFWDDEVLAGRMSSAPMQSSLRDWLAALYDQAIAANSNNAKFYGANNLSQALSYAIGDGKVLLRSLLASEAAVVRSAVDAGVSMAKFRKEIESAAAGGAKAADALKDLATFGSKITAAFNANIQTLFGGDEARAIGSAVYADAAKTLGEDLTAPTALVELTVLTQNSAFDLQSFLTGPEPSRAQVLLNQSVVNA